MILPFSTQINGKPTYFIQKIWRSIRGKYEIRSYIYSTHTKYFAPNELREKLKPKLHTIREDKNNRWKPGVMIDFFINTRTKDMFRFAPRIPVVSTQKIVIEYNPGKSYPWVWVDERLLNRIKLINLVENDGFDSIEDFFEYFNTDYTGKIIHWTDLKY